ncbi:MAG TPA: hypothetical protein VIY48_03855 [Candidatus Paceibacterota bacterium]
MFRLNSFTNVTQKRTLRPLYAQSQATPYGGFLSPSWTKAVDIYPGMVMAKLAGEVFTLAGTASGGGVLPAAGATPGASLVRAFGLSALFVAPTLGVDETVLSGLNTFTVWQGGPDATFEILAPAFATSQAWSETASSDGGIVMLGVTNASHTDGPGKLALMDGTNVVETPVARLIQYKPSGGATGVSPYLGFGVTGASIIVQLNDTPVIMADQTP